VKFKIGATAAALAFALVSGSLSAEPASSKILATSFASGTKVLSGLDSNFSFQALRHTAATKHVFAVLSYPPDPYLTAGDYPPDPYLTASDYPPDPYLTCRTLAATWNVAVYQNRSQTTFNALLKSAATNNCTVQITRAAVPNADGSTDLVSITFATQ
jgi:hypothetical protein